MSEMPAWIVCQGLLTKLKDELILEAMEVLHREIDAGRIKVGGSMVTLPDKSAEMERDMFIINNLIAESPKIHERYDSYVADKDSGAQTDPKMVQRIEELHRFLLGVDEIALLIRMSKTFNDWIEETGEHTRINDPSEIIRLTSEAKGERAEALRFVLGHRYFAKEGVLTEDEKAMIKGALG
ncbi:MAG: hypothetical protein KGH98_03035 [Candidatus Micrarchaeota archaeon]|nr:hypothetical protein [Candidatus Micrarchaeota archaeon]